MNVYIRLVDGTHLEIDDAEDIAFTDRGVSVKDGRGYTAIPKDRVNYWRVDV